MNQAGDIPEMLCALMDALPAPVTNRRARAICIEIFNISAGCSTLFKGFENIGARMVGKASSARAKQNAVSYALRRLGPQPLVSYETKNVTRTKKQSAFTCNWQLVTRALEIQQTLSFSPHQRQESYAEAASLALQEIGLSQNLTKTVCVSKSFPSAEHLESRVRKNKKTVLTLVTTIVRDVHALGLSPVSDLQEITNFINQIQETGGNLSLLNQNSVFNSEQIQDRTGAGLAVRARAPSWTLRHNINLSVLGAETFPPSHDELDEIGMVFTSAEENGTEVMPEIFEEAIEVAPAIKIQRIRSVEPGHHTLTEIALYRAWGLRYLRKTELDVNDECQGHAHKFSLESKRVAIESVKLANSNQWSVIIRPPHIIRAQKSGIAVVHLDDLQRDIGLEVVSYFGGLLKQTSRDSYQVLFPIYGVTYRTLFQQLSRGFIAGTSADSGANGATRLCGSLNVKPIYENRRGEFPMVQAIAVGRGRIRTVSEALSSPFYLPTEPQTIAAPIPDQSAASWGGDVPNIQEIERRIIATGQPGCFSSRRGYEGRASQSHVHYRFLCALALRMICNHKLNRDELRNLLLRESPSARERWARTPNYIDRTIEKAISRAEHKARTVTFRQRVAVA